MKKVLYFVVVMAMLSGCRSVPQFTGDQKAWMREVMKEDLTFTIPADSAEQVWSRGFKFLNLYSDMKLQTVSDYHIDTYNPDSGGLGFQYGYSMTRIKTGNNFEISLTGRVNNVLSDGWLKENMCIFARYMRTGDLRYPELIDHKGRLPYTNAMRSQYKEN